MAMTKNERIAFLHERLVQLGRELDALRERVLQLERSVPHKTPTGRQVLPRPEADLYDHFRPEKFTC